MTISSSLNAGVAGLSANASRLSTISDNIANSSTFGYKRATTDFHSMVTSSGNGPYTAGGVRVTSQRMIDQTASLVATSNSTDLAVTGGGFLPVTDEASVANGGGFPMRLATTGSFRADADGYLKTPTGVVLLGLPAAPDGTIESFARDTTQGLEPVRLQSNSFAGQPTENMTLGVNLPATESEAGASGDPLELSIEYFDSLGKPSNVFVTFTPDVSGPGASNEWVMELTDSASGNVVGQYDLSFSAAPANGGSLDGVVLSAGAPAGGAYNATTGTFDIAVASGTISVSVGLLDGSSPLTQLSDTFAPTQISKDGFAGGSLVSVEVDPNGFVKASYDTGIVRTLYQIPLVDVPNPNGLVSEDNQTYTISDASGRFFLWDAASGPTGSISGFALEESATDVAGELTAMIQTQRAYSSNAKVIQTVDEMMQETANIKR